MPRGQLKKNGVLTGVLGAEAKTGPGCSLVGSEGPNTEQVRWAIEQDATRFAQAWIQGDATAMSQCLHPDFVNRFMAVGSGPGSELREERGAQELVHSVVGMQGRLGAKTRAAGRQLAVRVLDVRRRCASAVVELGGWVLHMHLARAEGRWRIVNTMWEMAPGTRS